MNSDPSPDKWEPVEGRATKVLRWCSDEGTGIVINSVNFVNKPLT
jgi:hypothetical protein